MALSRVQASPQGSNGGGASVTLTFSAPPTIGNAVVAVVLLSGEPVANASCTDNRGNSYTLAKSQVGGNGAVDIFYCPAITATGTPFTITVAGNNFRGRVGVALEIGGVGSALSVDQTAGNAMTGATATVGPTAALTAGDVLLVAGVLVGGASTTITVDTPSPAWTQEFESLGGAVPAVGEVDSRIVPSATGTTPSATWTFGPTYSSSAALVAFTGAAPALVTVPDVVGETQADAVTAITAAGLTAGTLTSSPSAEAVGTVLSQSPAAGATVAPGTAVDLVVAIVMTAGLVVTIAGAARRVLHDSLSIQATVNGRDRLSLTTPPAAAPAPAPDLLLATLTGAPGTNGGVFGTMDSTGATLLICSVGWWAPNVATATLTDSKSNTWIPLTTHAGGDNRHKFYYCFSPTVGAGHTFAVGGGVLFYPAVVVYAFTGLASYQTESGAGATTGPVASGSVTPSAAGALVVTGMAAAGAAADAVAPAGFTVTTVPDGPSTRQQSAGVLVQAAAGAINPTWSWSAGSHTEIAVSTAVFLPAVVARTTAPAAVRQEIIVEEDGVRIFAGFIDTVVERAATSHTDSDVKKLYDLTAVDYNVLADWRLVNGPRPEETIKAYLTDLVLFLAGVTLDPAQVDGPLLPSRGQTFQTISQVLDEVTTITGYVWNIDYDGRLKMWLPSVEAAPFDILDSNDYAVGDITVEPSTTGYANLVWVLAGDSGQHDISSTFTGDGTTLTWNLPHGLVTHGGTLTHAGVTENVGPGQPWELDALPTPYAFTLRRAIGSAPAVGALIVFPYTAQYPLIFRAEDSAAIAAVGFIVEQVFHEPTVFDPAQGQALADGYLAQLVQDVREVRYTTLRGDVSPGQTQTITIANRGLSGSFVITDVETRMRDPLLFRQVTARNPGPYAGNWRDVYKLWAQGQTSAAAYAGTSSAPPAVTPGTGTSAAYFLGASAVEWQRVTAPVDWVPAGGVQVQPQGMTSGTVTARLRALAGTVTARLQDVTASTTAGTSSVVASPTFQPVTFAVGLTAGHTYELQLLPSLPAVDVQGIGVLS